MDFKNITPKFDFENSENSDNFVASITHQLFTQIVKEEDEYTLNIIEEYVKNKQHEGECIAAKIIPEGKLRHIINLGLARYAAQEHIDLKPADYLLGLMDVDIINKVNKLNLLNQEYDYKIKEVLYEKI